MWRSKGQITGVGSCLLPYRLQESNLGGQSAKLGSKHLYPLSHPLAQRHRFKVPEVWQNCQGLVKQRRGVATVRSRGAGPCEGRGEPWPRVGGTWEWTGPPCRWTPRSAAYSQFKVEHSSCVHQQRPAEGQLQSLRTPTPSSCHSPASDTPHSYYPNSRMSPIILTADAATRTGSGRLGEGVACFTHGAELGARVRSVSN